jgi:predicted TIM-barrel fold metal-dependent hydrolase
LTGSSTRWSRWSPRRRGRTTFVGAHVGCAAEDLDRVEAMMAAYPNFNVDLGGRVAEIGRQPRRFRRLALAYPDRVLFGTDSFPLDSAALRTLFRFLETDDEHFPYAPQDATPPTGRWAISGVHLPPDVLAAVYAGNATRLLSRRS